MKFSFGHFSVTRRIFLTLMALFALVVVGIAVTIYLTIASSVETAVLGNITRDMTIIGRDFDNWLSVKSGRLELLSTSVQRFYDRPVLLQSILADAVRADPDTPFVYFGSARRGSEWRMRAEGYISVGDGFFLDGSGWIADADYNWLERPWFEPALRSRRPVISGPYTDEGTGETVVTLSMACISETGEVLGVLALDMYLSRINSAVSSRNFSADSGIWLVDSRGRFVTFNGEDAATPFNQDSLFDPDSPLHMYRQRLQLEDTTSGLLRSHDMYFASSRIPHTDWLIVSIGPISAVAGLVSDFYQTLVVVSMSAMLLAIALALFESRHIAKPVKALKKGALALAAGDLAYRVQIQNDDEFGELASFFNRIAESLYQDMERMDEQRAEIERYSQTLEIKVSERTQALNEANTMLRMRNDQIEEEVQMAAAVQRKIIPTEAELPVCPWLSFGARYQAMANVGGDLYDVIDLGERCYAFIIGDVSGHGIPAALIAAMAKVSFRSHTLRGRKPSEILRTVNEEMCLLIGDETYFLSAFIAVLDVGSAELLFANAGHHPALLRRQDGQVEELDIPDGQLIGISEHFICSNGFVQLQVQDRLVFYTDGIVEARSRSGEYYDVSRLRTLLSEYGSGRPSAIVGSILEEVNSFASGMQQSDDRAILIVGLNSLPTPESCPLCNDADSTVAEACRLEQQGLVQAAANLMEDLRHRRPDDPVVMNVLARYRLKLGDLAGAERLLRTAVGMQPDSAEFSENLRAILDAQNE
ncbi:MAG: SpoIIE family protein phosphatase [Spirochaetes bacterium]|nr:SpoIIE family protein phosphatase [Spirochaetota bacterium]MBU0957161.1 SpoIIE family protein phosphatase [Spirochaetota bacterium]